MDEFPPFVLQIRNALRRDPGHKWLEVAEKLMADRNPELTKMWRTLYRGEEQDYDELYVYAFLGQCHDAMKLPRYRYLTQKERFEVGKKINALASELSTTLIEYELQSHIVAAHGKMFHGFYFYEDLSESNQFRADQSNDPKASDTNLLEAIASRARRQLSEVRLHGKQGKGQRAILFIRSLNSSLVEYRHAQLHEVVATAANALFGTQYTKGDISNLMNR